MCVSVRVREMKRVRVRERESERESLRLEERVGERKDRGRVAKRLRG